MIPFNDAAAWINGSGNLTLGVSQDDASADATHKYAKGDIFIDVPLNACVLTGSGNAFSRASAGVWQIAASTAATACTVGFDLSWLNFRKYTGSLATSAPHGFKWTDIIVYWIVGSTNASATSVTFTTTTYTDNVTLPAGVTTTYGTIAYENPIGTSVTAPPTTQRANGYLWRAIPGTTASPIANALFNTTDNMKVNCEIAFTTGATSGTVTISYIGIHGSVALL
jgi:hypothetical protein